ncbi:MAG: hypothetical protein H6Q04_2678 [Acidobacteria bacterium]|nr:hypothetical protein [Acidobacteriota bacterium]
MILVLEDGTPITDSVRYGFYELADLTGLDFRSPQQDYEESDIRSLVLYYGKNPRAKGFENSGIIQIVPRAMGQLGPMDDCSSNPTKAHAEAWQIVARLSKARLFGDFTGDERMGWINGRILKVPFDFPMLIYRLLNLEHESNGEIDNLGRPIGKTTWAFREGLYLLPLLEAVSEVFWTICCIAGQRTGIPVVRKNRWPGQFSSCLAVSHDIDVVRMWTLRHTVKEFLPALIKPGLKPTSGMVKAAGASWCDGRKDPYWNFGKIAALEKKHGVRSTYFFLCRSRTQRISGQRIVGSYGSREYDVHRAIRELRSDGFEIGLHGGIDSSGDPEVLKKQKRGLERLAGADCEGIRQHFLLYEKRRTPLAQSEAGFTYDSTFGFRDLCGYRALTGLPFTWPELYQGTSSPFLEIPLIIMDSALMIHGGADKDKCCEIIDAILDDAAKFNSLTTVLWHNTSFGDTGHPWPEETFDHILSKTRRAGGWTTTLGEVASWWNARRQVRMKLKRCDFRFHVEMDGKFKGASLTAEIFVPGRGILPISHPGNSTHAIEIPEAPSITGSQNL